MPSALTRLYRYVGPAAIARESREVPSGHPVRHLEDLRRAMRSIAGSARAPATFTFVVDRVGVLRLADRCSEHVACAGGGPVMAAGEITLAADGEVLDVSNQSTGFCPEVECGAAISRALRAAGLDGPDHLTAPFEFRRCPNCAARSLIKDGVFECPECAAALPERWNFEPSLCRRAIARLGEAPWLVDAIEDRTEASGTKHASVSLRPERWVLGVATARGRAAVDELAQLEEQNTPPLDLRLAAMGPGASGAVVTLSPDGSLRGASRGNAAVWASDARGWRERTDTRPTLGVLLLERGLPHGPPRRALGEPRGSGRRAAVATHRGDEAASGRGRGGPVAALRASADRLRRGALIGSRSRVTRRPTRA